MLRSSLLALTIALTAGVTAPTAVEARDTTRGLSGAYLAARHASRFGDYEAAAEYYVKALSRDRGNPELLENAILAFTGLGKINGAVPIARQMQSLGYDSQIANMLLMTDQLDRGDLDAVLADIEAGRSVGPLVDGLVTAWALVGQGQMADAVAAFDAAAEATGLQAFGLYHKALAKATAGDFEGAAEIMSGEAETPLRLTFRGIVAYAQVLSQLDRNDDAIELIAAAFGPDPAPRLAAMVTRLEAGETLAFDLIRDARDGQAEVFYSVAGALNGEASDGYTLLYTRMAEHLRPNHIDAVLLSADLLEKQGQYALATAAYDRVPREDPAFHSAELGRAAALRASGKVEAAIEVLQQLAESHGDVPTVHITLGDTLRQQERYDEASEAYDAAVALLDGEDPDQWIVYYARGITHEREKRWPLAEADFRKALELNPGQPQVLNYLGYSFVEMNTNLDEALAMIEEAVAARPDSGYITDSLGWVLYRLGRYAEAVPHMERAAELMPVDPIVNDHLGDVYWAVGRVIEAEFQWRRALSFDPEEKEAIRIRRKLEVGLDVVLAEEGRRRSPLPMATSRITARAKINLTLHVTGQRADGYHLLDSLVVFADLGDVITARSAPGLSFVTDGPFANEIPMDGSNLVLRAADVMLERAPAGSGASITLYKELPAASGIGGGSADAAATLTALSRIWAVDLPPSEQVVTLGADVPVCLRGEASHLRGIGDELSPLTGLPECWAVLVNPGVAVPTSNVFAALAEREAAPMQSPFPEVDNIYDFAAWLSEQRNDLQAAATGLAPEIGAVLRVLGQMPDCLLARMSGSGATCFGLFADEPAAIRGADALKKSYGDWWVKPTRLR